MVRIQSIFIFLLISVTITKNVLAATYDESLRELYAHIAFLSTIQGNLTKVSQSTKLFETITNKIKDATRAAKQAEAANISHHTTYLVFPAYIESALRDARTLKSNILNSNSNTQLITLATEAYNSAMYNIETNSAQINNTSAAEATKQARRLHLALPTTIKGPQIPPPPPPSAASAVSLPQLPNRPPDGQRTSHRDHTSMAHPSEPFQNILPSAHYLTSQRYAQKDLPKPGKENLPEQLGSALRTPHIYPPLTPPPPISPNATILTPLSHVPLPPPNKSRFADTTSNTHSLLPPLTLRPAPLPLDTATNPQTSTKPPSLFWPPSKPLLTLSRPPYSAVIPPAASDPSKTTAQIPIQHNNPSPILDPTDKKTAAPQPVIPVTDDIFHPITGSSDPAAGASHHESHNPLSGSIVHLQARQVPASSTTDSPPASTATVVAPPHNPQPPEHDSNKSSPRPKQQPEIQNDAHQIQIKTRCSPFATLLNKFTRILCCCVFPRTPPP